MKLPMEHKVSELLLAIRYNYFLTVVVDGKDRKRRWRLFC